MNISEVAGKGGKEADVLLCSPGINLRYSFFLVQKICTTKHQYIFSYHKYIYWIMLGRLSLTTCLTLFIE